MGLPDDARELWLTNTSNARGARAQKHMLVEEAKKVVERVALLDTDAVGDDTFAELIEATAHLAEVLDRPPSVRARGGLSASGGDDSHPHRAVRHQRPQQPAGPADGVPARRRDDPGPRHLGRGLRGPAGLPARRVRGRRLRRPARLRPDGLRHRRLHRDPDREDDQAHAPLPPHRLRRRASTAPRAARSSAGAPPTTATSSSPKPSASSSPPPNPASTAPKPEP